MRFAAVGDIMLQHRLAENPLHALLRDADLTLANLEVPLSTRGEPADKPIAFRAAPDLAAELARMGVDVVSLANNHALDYGVPALLDTIAAAEAVGITVVGAGRSLGEAIAARTKDVEGIKLAFLAFSSTLPVGSAATEARAGVAPIRVQTSILADAPVMEEQPGTSPYMKTEIRPEDLERAQAAVARAQREADSVIVSMHWGVPPGWVAPFQGLLADYQRPLGRALVDAGADLILGHHPHTLHGVEIYRGRFICYSLGHFVFHSLAEGAHLVLQRPGPPYQLEHVRVPELNESAVFVFDGAPPHWRVDLTPCTMNRHGEFEPATPDGADTILSRFAALCDALGTSVVVREGHGAIEAERGEER